MPEPTVDLNLGPPAQPPQTSNPLGLLHSVADLQQTLNANRLFQQQWQARQVAGGIIASAPDWSTAAKALQANPQVSGFLPEITSAALHNAQTNQEIAGQRQTQAQSALQGVYSGLAIAAAKPELFDQAFSQSVGAIPKETQDYLRANGDPIGSLRKVLAPLAKSDPEGFQRILAAGQLMTVSPSQVFATTGRTAPVLTPQGTGGGLGVRGGFGEAGGPAATPAVTPPQPAAASTDFLGKPLTPDPKDFIPSRRDAGGLPIREPQEQDQITDSGTSFLKDTHTLYPAAANSISMLNSAKDEIQTLAHNGRGTNWLVPGAGGNLRLGLAKTLNTVYSLFNPGKEPPIDTTKTGAGEALQKTTRNLAFSLSNSMMGQHGGLGVLEDAYQAVPGIENSPLGGMLVADTLKASSQWLLDQQAFKQQWANANHGDLRNADQVFMQRNPPSAYIAKVMDQYGLGPKGFAPGSQERIGELLRDNLISKEMAVEAWKKLGIKSKNDKAQ